MVIIPALADGQSARWNLSPVRVTQTGRPASATCSTATTIGGGGVVAIVVTTEARTDAATQAPKVRKGRRVLVSTP